MDLLVGVERVKGKTFPFAASFGGSAKEENLSLSLTDRFRFLSLLLYLLFSLSVSLCRHVPVPGKGPAQGHAAGKRTALLLLLLQG